MRHISIEGMDGVGKTTVCKLLARKLGFKFIEKPLHYLLDKDENSFEEYIRVRDKVNENPNRVFTSLFYGLGSAYMYEMFKDDNIITDRHFASNYAWSGTDDNKEVYDLLISKLGVPELTVILYAPKEIIKERLVKRNPNDLNLSKVNMTEKIYEKMIYLCKTKNMPFVLIDTSNLTPEEVVNKIVMEINK